jgi:DNA replication protein DnaC
MRVRLVGGILGDRRRRRLLTTNRTFREWGTLFDVDNTLATALIDRLMHHGEALVIKGDSYRMKDKPDDKPSDPPSA